VLLCQASHFAKEGQELCLGDEPFLVGVETREKLHQRIFWALGVGVKTSCARHVLEFLQGEHMVAVLVQAPEKFYRLRVARRGAFHVQCHPGQYSWDTRYPINWYREIQISDLYSGPSGPFFLSSWTARVLYAPPKLLGAFALRSV
jgi:hypothetical protein